MSMQLNKIKKSALGIIIMFSFLLSFNIIFAEGGYGDNIGTRDTLNENSSTEPVADGPNSGSGYPNDDAYAPAGSGSGTSNTAGSSGGSSWFNVFMGTSSGGSGYGTYNSSGGYGGNSGFGNGTYYQPNFIGTTNTTSGSTSINFAPMKVNLPSGTCSKITDIGSLFKFVTCTVINSVIPLIILFAVTVFLWGTTMFMMNTADTTKRKEGKQFMLWGLLALFIIVSYWGIVKMFGDTLGFSGVKPPQLQDDIYPQL